MHLSKIWDIFETVYYLIKLIYLKNSDYEMDVKKESVKEENE